MDGRTDGAHEGSEPEEPVVLPHARHRRRTERTGWKVQETEGGQSVLFEGLCSWSGMKLEGVRFCVCALCAFIVLPVFLCALCGRTGVDGAVVDADHAEVHQRHRQTDGQGRQGLCTRRGEGRRRG